MTSSSRHPVRVTAWTRATRDLLAAILVATAAHAQECSTWRALGPFPHPQGTLELEPPQAVERELKTMGAGGAGPDLAATYKLRDGVRHWVELTRGANDGRALDVGVVDLARALAPDNAPQGWSDDVAGYLYRRIDCSDALELPVMFGSDDGVRVWLNGELVAERAVARSLVVEDHVLTLQLRAGTNHLFVKVVNAGANWEFELQPWRRIEQKLVDRAIDRGVQYLRDQQLLDGSWGDHEQFGAGHTAFTAYTLLVCGVPADDPVIQLAFAAADARSMEHTYSAACVALAYAATHAERFRPRVERAVQQLLDQQDGEGLYTYPQYPGQAGMLPADLSNTLYAALAFRAAERAGIDIPDKAWANVAQGALRCLTKETSAGNATGKFAARAAGFSYRANTNEPTGSMTTAGLSVLALAQEGTDGKLPPALAQRARAAVGLGLTWLERNFEWGQNPGQNAHHYFWVYGVERAGTLLGLETLGGLDWYWAGASYLVRKQQLNGSWSSSGQAADEPIDTLLALLFLKRATAPVSGATFTPRSRTPRAPATADAGAKTASWDAGGENDALAIHARGEALTVLWVSGLRADLRQALSGPKGLDVQKLEFLAQCSDEPASPEQVIGTLGARVVLAEDLSRLELTHVFARPGTWTVRARLSVLVAGTQTRVVETPSLSFVVRTVFDQRRLDYAGDPARNVLRGQNVTFAASSGAAKAKAALDGFYGTDWTCDTNDATPWIRLTPQRPIQAERLVLAHALNRAKDAEKPRANQVEIVINGELTLALALANDGQLKSAIELPPRTPVRTLELRIKSLHGGRLGAAAVGFSEIELAGAR